MKRGKVGYRFVGRYRAVVGWDDHGPYLVDLGRSLYRENFRIVSTTEAPRTREKALSYQTLSPPCLCYPSLPSGFDEDSSLSSIQKPPRSNSSSAKGSALTLSFPTKPPVLTHMADLSMKVSRVLSRGSISQ